MKKLLLSLVNKLNKWQVRRIMRRAGIPEPEIKRLELDADKNRMTIVAEHPAVMDLAAALVSFFDGQGATNFVEMQIGTPRGLFLVTVRPQDGKPAGEVVAEQRDLITLLENDCRRLDWVERQWRIALDCGPADEAAAQVHLGWSIRDVIDEWMREDEILEPVDA